MNKFFQAVEQTADSVFVTDKNGVIQYVNPAFTQMTGYSREEAIGKTPRLVKSGKHKIDYYKKMWSTILSGKDFRTTSVNRRKDGSFFYADHTISPIKDDKGKVTHFVGIWKDISDRIEMEKKKDEFLAIASHELRTPITSISVYSQILEKN